MNALSINIPANFIATCESTLAKYSAAQTDAERRAILDCQTVQGLWWAIGFCWSCEHIRGRGYVDNSIKSVEVKEA